MCVTEHKLSEVRAAVGPSAPLELSSLLVMWVHYRKRPVLPSLVSTLSLPPWTGINATPLPDSLHDLNASGRTETVSEG